MDELEQAFYELEKAASQIDNLIIRHEFYQISQTISCILIVILLFSIAGRLKGINAAMAYNKKESHKKTSAEKFYTVCEGCKRTLEGDRGSDIQCSGCGRMGHIPN